MNKKQCFKDAFGWGIILWLIGYALGIMLFTIVPPTLLGWVISPIGTIITLWILFKKIRSEKFYHYVTIGGVWTLIAIIFDYIFLVKAFAASDYYKLDIYIYYSLTFILPIIVGWWKTKKI